ncbi:MAG TPA: hypothetical protein DCR93_27815 [Cytophagales bacterium]|nr:hypothetical protein [Cytophagales bacterium]HAP63145.1 hypothetical protein [Cytophagales bacterium]
MYKIVIYQCLYKKESQLKRVGILSVFQNDNRLIKSGPNFLWVWSKFFQLTLYQAKRQVVTNVVVFP